MRLSPATFWATLLAVFAIGASAGTDVISNHLAINQIVVAVSTAALIGLTFNQIWPRPLEVIVGRLRKPQAANEPDPFIPLPEAARRAYEAARDNNHGEYSRTYNKTEEDHIEWWAYRLRQLSLPIYGKRPLSSVIDLIPNREISSGHFRDGATKLDLGTTNPLDNYVDLVVKTSDLMGIVENVDKITRPR